MLSVSDVVVYYGRVRVLDGISLQVSPGRIFTLIGANGVGKTTTLRTISGLVRPTTGAISFAGAPLTKLSPAQVVRLGIAHCPEGRRLFPNLTVFQNLRLGAYSRGKDPGVDADIDTVYGRFPILKNRSNQQAGTLSGGEQQMLAMGRALMAKPKLLLLDEPSLGLAPAMVKEIFAIIADINKQGTSILLVEQNAKMALKIADYGYVMERGRIALEGPAAELAENDEVRRVYFGAG
jgi:branched-chain amino acid transport system ATP-binding protein